MEGSLLLGRLGIQESFGLEGLVEVNSGLLEAKNLGSRFRFDLVLWLGRRDFVAYGGV